MNSGQTEGAFEQLKGKVKRIWGEITDDDLKKVEGSVDRLYGMIQQRFGGTKEDIKRKPDQLH